jgi:hypothetical protein
MKILLTKEQYKEVVESAKEFLQDSKVKGLNADRYSGKKPIEFQVENQVVGCAGEFAVAYALGIKDFKPKIGVYHRVPDIDPDIEVRGSINKPHKRLIIRDNDYFSRKFVFVKVDLNIPDTAEVEIVGWLTGHEAKTLTKPSYGNTNYSSSYNSYNQKPAYFIENKDLHPFEDLLKYYDDYKRTNSL